MSARAIWKGTINLGLMNIPIKLYTTVQDESVHYTQLDAEGHKIQLKKWCPVDEREVSNSEIQKGYEVAKGEYVILTDEELPVLENSKSIQIKEFISHKELDPIFIEKSYYVIPEVQNKAYSLLLRILRFTKRIAIGKVQLRSKDQLVALRAYQRGLVMHELYYLYEIKEAEAIPEVNVKVEAKERELTKLLITQMTSKTFDISKYKDEYTDKLRHIIEAKAKAKAKVVKEKEKEKPKVVIKSNLIETLKRSLEESKK